MNNRHGSVKIFALVAMGIIFVGFVLFGSSLGNVVETAIENTRDRVKMNLGKDFRIDQAENLVKEAKLVIKSQRIRVSTLRVQVTDLHHEIKQNEQKLWGLRNAFVELDDAWARSGDGAHSVKINGKDLSGEDLRRALEHTASTLDLFANQMKGKRKLHAVRQDALRQAEKHLGDIERRHDQIQIALESSRFDLECVKLMNDAVGKDVNASNLAKAEEIIIEVAEELRIQREMITFSGNDDFIDSIINGSETSTLVERVRRESRMHWEDSAYSEGVSVE